MTSTLALPVVESGTDRLTAILAERPLYIGVETTNICNARCVFCAYPKMRRAKEVMSPELFRKIVSDYVEMGGGAIGLTPIVGDVLIDPHLLDRLRLLRETEEITNVSFTTNAIAWDRYDESQQRSILQSTRTICISIGGLDETSYTEMFAVDRFAKVRRAIDDMCRIKSRDGLPVELHLLFRVNRTFDELMSDPRMEAMRRAEITSITSINNFGNWGGVIEPNDLPDGAHLVQVETAPDRIRKTKRNPCFVFYVNPEITCNGLVSACGCMNAEAEELILGDVRTQHLRDIWRGAKRRELKAAFGTDALSDICKRCSYYADGERFIRQPGLDHFRIGDNPWELIRRDAGASPCEQLADILGRLVGEGYQRIALYGAGTFTRTALLDEGFDASGWPIVAVIDDNQNLMDGRIADLPIVSRDKTLTLGVDAAILCTDWHTQSMWNAAKPLRDAGVHVAPIDSHFVPSGEL